jgi:hypothetical protein
MTPANYLDNDPLFQKLLLHDLILNIDYTQGICEIRCLFCFQPRAIYVPPRVMGNTAHRFFCPSGQCAHLDGADLLARFPDLEGEKP